MTRDDVPVVHHDAELASASGERVAIASVAIASVDRVALTRPGTAAGPPVPTPGP